MNFLYEDVLPEDEEQLRAEAALDGQIVARHYNGSRIDILVVDPKSSKIQRVPRGYTPWTSFKID